MSPSTVQQLLKENQSLLLRERRMADRIPFVRPVVIQHRRGDETFHGFTRDISSLGIGVICPVPWEPPTFAILDIHSLNGRDATFKAESRWCEDYGDGWYVIGFIFRS
jgi:hypothetical protein